MSKIRLSYVDVDKVGQEREVFPCSGQINDLTAATLNRTQDTSLSPAFQCFHCKEKNIQQKFKNLL